MLNFWLDTFLAFQNMNLIILSTAKVSCFKYLISLPLRLLMKDSSPQTTLFTVPTHNMLPSLNTNNILKIYLDFLDHLNCLYYTAFVQSLNFYKSTMFYKSQFFFSKSLWFYHYAKLIILDLKGDSMVRYHIGLNRMHPVITSFLNQPANGRIVEILA